MGWPAPVLSAPGAAAPFTCSICFELRDTRALRELLCCHRLCCDECLAAHGRARGDACPCCRAPDFERRAVEENVLFSRLANDVEASCPCCEWRGGLRDFWREHRCPAARGPCFLGCGAELSGAEVRQHLEECPKNVERCEICGATHRAGAGDEHRAEAAQEHVRLLLARSSAAEQAAEAAARRAPREERGFGLAWLLAPAGGWAEEGHETRPYFAPAGVGLWLRLEATETGADVFLCADGALRLEGVTMELRGAAGSEWRVSDRLDLDVDVLADSDEDYDEEDFRSAEPVASWRGEGLPRCSFRLRAREILVY